MAVSGMALDGGVWLVVGGGAVGDGGVDLAVGVVGCAAELGAVVDHAEVGEVEAFGGVAEDLVLVTEGGVGNEEV